MLIPIEIGSCYVVPLGNKFGLLAVPLNPAPEEEGTLIAEGIPTLEMAKTIAGAIHAHNALLAGCKMALDVAEYRAGNDGKEWEAGLLLATLRLAVGMGTRGGEVKS